MNGTIAGKRTTHDVNVEWVLKREYLRFHEVSREKDAGGGPAYEAIVFLSWEVNKGEYSCLWMDNTGGGALSSDVIARARPAAGAIPLVFTKAGKELLHTTFRYDARADSWQLTIRRCHEREERSVRRRASYAKHCAVEIPIWGNRGLVIVAVSCKGPGMANRAMGFWAVTKTECLARSRYSFPWWSFLVRKW